MKTAMILAAGRGERLKPLTLSIPKAMCQVKGKPLIEHHVINLVKAGFSKIVINHAYLGDHIRRYLGNGDKWGVELCYSPEPPGGLETGGGIVSALPYLGYEPFLTVNADIYTDFDFNTLTLPDASLAHLVLGENPGHNPAGDFGLNPQQQLMNQNRHYTFLGIACYHPEAFSQYHIRRYSVIPLVRNLADQSRASGVAFNGLWMDIGTIERLRYANDN